MTSESRASTAKSSLTYHRIIEAFKFGYSWRARLGDPAFVSGMSEVGKITTDVNAMYSSVFFSFLCRLKSFISKRACRGIFVKVYRLVV